MLLSEATTAALFDPDCTRSSEERYSPKCEEQADVLIGGLAVAILVTMLLVALWLLRVRRRLLRRDPDFEG